MKVQVKIQVMVVSIALTACGDDALPRCEDVGCPYQPSGDPSIWTPCEDETCFCMHPSPTEDLDAVACTRSEP